MNISICTTPIGSTPTNYPPFGSMAIIQALRKVGEKASFFNIDYFRYSHGEIEAYFSEHQFEVVGISSVVSTAYAYTKYLSNLIHEVSPHTVIIVGGNLAASAEILLRKCSVDICVVGDGERIIQTLIRALNGKPLNFDLLRAVKGICFLDEKSEFCFTGYGERIPAEDIEWPDYSILEEDGSLPHFISDKVDELVYGYEGVIEPGKKMATVVMSKGCVARCTFCHRWEKGYRVRPVEQIMEHIRYLVQRYNVGVLTIADENFGSDRETASEIASWLGEQGIVWSVGGVRTSTVRKESLKHWKDNGCYMAIFGVESGSPRMLSVMEKNLTLEKNINAIKWTGEAGLGTVIQLVLGMPGENDETVRETTEFLKEISSTMKWWQDKAASDLISINYAQALPGTPLYEYLRQHGLIGSSVDEEEKYLIQISDIDAYKEDHFVNATGLPLLKVLMWRPLILSHVDAYHYLNQGNVKRRLPLFQVASYYAGLFWVKLSQRVNKRIDAVLKRKEKTAATALGAGLGNISESGYFNIHAGLKFAPLLFNPLTRQIFYPLLAVIVAVRVSNSPLHALKLLYDHARWSFLGGTPLQQDQQEKSLRKTVTIMPSTPYANGKDMMLPLRSGR